MKVVCRMRRGMILRAVFALALICVAAGTAHADSLLVRSTTRQMLRLNGAWKTSVEDRAAFSRPDFDDSAWSQANLPMTSPLPAGAGHVRWFRKKFSLPVGRIYDSLWMDGIRDAAEVWLNGMRLRDPALLPPMDAIRFGVYDRLWPNTMESTIPVETYMRARGRNVIAVRVTADDTRPWGETNTWADGPHLSPPGLYGDVALLSRPDPWIMSIERRSTLVSPAGAQVDHAFFVMLNNGGIRNAPVEVTLTISNDSGAVVARLNNKRTLPTGGDIVKFSWRTDASFETFQARAVLLNGDDRVMDTRTLRFQGFSVTVERGRLYLNGEPFVLRGVNGTPGLTYGKEGKNAFRASAVDDELDRLAGAGFNVVRTAAPPPSLLHSALAEGMMVVPVLSGRDFARTVTALRESPAVLFWDASETDRDTAARIAAFVRAMDPYRRPVAGGQETSGSLVGRDGAGSNSDKLCPASWANPDAPSFYSRWGRPVKSGGVARLLREMSFLQNRWDACIDDGRIIGAFYQNLYELSPGAPGLRGASPTGGDGRFLEMWPRLFSDLRIHRSITRRGDPALILEPAEAAALRNLDVIFVGTEGSMRAAGGLRIERGDQSVVALKPGVIEARINYETHGGLKHRVIIPLGRPAWDPDIMRPLHELWALRPGGKIEIQFYAHNPARQEVWAQLTAPKPPAGYRIEPASRRINISPNGTLRVAFTITAPKNARPGTLTPRFDLRFDGNAVTPTYAWTVLEVR